MSVKEREREIKREHRKDRASSNVGLRAGPVWFADTWLCWKNILGVAVCSCQALRGSVLWEGIVLKDVCEGPGNLPCHPLAG